MQAVQLSSTLADGRCLFTTTGPQSNPQVFRFRVWTVAQNNAQTRRSKRPTLNQVGQGVALVKLQPAPLPLSTLER
jgi:hypothetical protein